VTPQRKPLNYDRLLTPGEAASLLGVVPKTTITYANRGLLTTVRTIGGHRRFFEDEVRRLVAESKEPRRP
jgi:excisionase family DNA binding protein